MAFQESFINMEKRKLISLINNSILLPTKYTIASAASLLKNGAKGKSSGLIALYKDMEACAGYTDIRVMWEMVHTSYPPVAERESSSSKGFKFWKSCFQTV